jgi:hypothetical protein
MRLFDVVRLNDDLPTANLLAAAEGTLVEEIVPGQVFLVEFEREVVELSVEQLALHTPYFREGERVALLVEHPDQALRRGQVGIVHEYGIPTCDVIFENEQGQEYARHSILTADLMILHWQPAQRSA